MKVLIRAIVAASLAVGAAHAADAAGDAAIETFERGQLAAWNAHDSRAYAEAFASDADVITALGWHWTGRDDVARNMDDGFRLVYAHALFRIDDIDVRALSADVALVRMEWTVTGARTPDGAAPVGEQHGIETQVVQGTGPRRAILLQQDTLSTPSARSAGVTPSSATAPTPIPAATRFPTTPPPVHRCIVARANGDCLIFGKAKPAAQ
jgi:uncharacterized protein (TIGR02246 family)